MTDTSLDDLPWWGGTYALSRSAREAPGGWDATQAVVEARVRETARQAGHEPRGAVVIAWHDVDPDDPRRIVEREEGVEPEPDPGRVWAVARVRVEPNGHARRTGHVLSEEEYAKRVTSLKRESRS